MSAEQQGITQGRKFTQKLETMTREQYRRIGRTEAENLYRSKEKQNEFMKGWFEINQQFFCLMKDGPRRRILEVKLWCERCGGFETIEVKKGESVANLKYRPCPDCEKREG